MSHAACCVFCKLFMTAAGLGHVIVLLLFSGDLVLIVLVVVFGLFSGRALALTIIIRADLRLGLLQGAFLRVPITMPSMCAMIGQFCLSVGFGPQVGQTRTRSKGSGYPFATLMTSDSDTWKRRARSHGLLDRGCGPGAGGRVVLCSQVSALDTFGFRLRVCRTVYTLRPILRA